MHQPQVQQPTLTTASASSSSPIVGEINTTMFDPQPTSTTSPLDQHPRGTTSGLDAQLRASSSTILAYTTGPPAEHLQQEHHNIFMRRKTRTSTTSQLTRTESSSNKKKNENIYYVNAIIFENNSQMRNLNIKNRRTNLQRCIYDILIDKLQRARHQQR